MCNPNPWLCRTAWRSILSLLLHPVPLKHLHMSHWCHMSAKEICNCTRPTLKFCSKATIITKYYLRGLVGQRRAFPTNKLRWLLLRLSTIRIYIIFLLTSLQILNAYLDGSVSSDCSDKLRLIKQMWSGPACPPFLSQQQTLSLTWSYDNWVS